jgi:hypothetical protein
MWRPRWPKASREAFVRTPNRGAAARLGSFGREKAPDGPIFAIATYPLI